MSAFYSKILITRRLQAFTSLVRSEIQSLQFSCSPCRILMHAEAATTDSDWLLIGLSEKRNLLRSCSPKDIMLVLPFALLLAALSWPLQRLWMWRAERAAAAERYDCDRTLFAGLYVVISLLGVPNIRGNYRKRGRMSSSRFRRIHRLTFQEQSSNSQFGSCAVLTTSRPRRCAIQDEHSGAFPDWKDVYLPFEYADWINSEGEKTIRWTPKSTPPQRVNVLTAATSRTSSWIRLCFCLIFRLRSSRSSKFLSRTSGQAATMIAIASKLSKVTSRPLR